MKTEQAITDKMAIGLSVACAHPLFIFTRCNFNATKHCGIES